MASHLLSQEFNLVSTDKAVFIWAALSLYWLQLAQQIPHNSRQEGTDNLHYCPVCGLCTSIKCCPYRYFTRFTLFTLQSL